MGQWRQCKVNRRTEANNLRKDKDTNEGDITNSKNLLMIIRKVLHVY